MTNREPLEQPQASLLEEIEAEIAEEALLEVENIDGLLKWKRIHAWLTIGIIGALVFGLLLSVLVGTVSTTAAAFGFALSVAATGICIVGSFIIAFFKPAIFLIAPDGSVKPQKAAKYSFIFFWLSQGGFALIFFVLFLLLAGFASLF
jgi:hypothetical protein